MTMHRLPAPRRLTVSAVAGRLYPAGRAETWIGWERCADGDPACPRSALHMDMTQDCTCGFQVHEHLLPAGTGPGDAPALDYIVTDPETGEVKTDLDGKPIRRVIAERITGRIIRLRRTAGGTDVPDHPIIRKAIADGDLRIYTAPPPSAAHPDLIAEAARTYKHEPENAGADKQENA